MQSANWEQFREIFKYHSAQIPVFLLDSSVRESEWVLSLKNKQTSKKHVCVFKADQSWLGVWPDMRRSRCNLLPSAFSKKGTTRLDWSAHSSTLLPLHHHAPWSFSGTLPTLLLWTAPKSNSIAPHHPPRHHGSLPPSRLCTDLTACGLWSESARRWHFRSSS